MNKLKFLYSFRKEAKLISVMNLEINVFRIRVVGKIAELENFKLVVRHEIGKNKVGKLRPKFVNTTDVGK